MSAIVNLTGRAIEVVYRTGKTGRGPVSVELNGTPLELSRQTNRYRLAGVRIPMDSWSGHLKEQKNRLIITLE
jgi:hypothetical protein